MSAFHAWAMCAVAACCAVAGCDSQESKAERLAPPLRPISAEAVTKAKDPRFNEYRELLHKQFLALKSLGEFYGKATDGGSRPLSESDLERHNALRGECNVISEQCSSYVTEQLSDVDRDVLQSIQDEEQGKVFPPE